MSIVFDEISRWSEVKLDIITLYAVPYMDIMKAKKFKAHYIDGFSGAGVHVRKNSGDAVAGSPLRVLDIPKPFDTYYFVDLDGSKMDFLEEVCKGQFPDRNTVIKRGDCSEVLMRILPEFSRENYDRLFCLLDPYGCISSGKLLRKWGLWA